MNLASKWKMSKMKETFFYVLYFLDVMIRVKLMELSYCIQSLKVPEMMKAWVHFVKVKAFEI